jgi:hypothetical protein
MFKVPGFGLLDAGCSFVNQKLNTIDNLTLLATTN